MDSCALGRNLRSPDVGLEPGDGAGASDEMRLFFAGGPPAVELGLTKDGGRKGLPIMACSVGAERKEA